MKNIVIDGVEYVEKAPAGNRYVVVVDRGWIWAGDIVESTEKHIILDNVLWLFGWSSVGFSAVLDNPKSDKVDLRTCNQKVEIPVASVIFKIPVGDDWGK